jgi:hypothetical protein
VVFVCLGDDSYGRSWVNEGIDSIIRGSAAQLQQEVDLFYVQDVRSFLFGLPGAGGTDLAALSIERGRDHGNLSFLLSFFSQHFSFRFHNHEISVSFYEIFLLLLTIIVILSTLLLFSFD